MFPFGVTIPATVAEVGNPGGTYELPCIYHDKKTKISKNNFYPWLGSVF
jgi:hypothetical protein